jgi:hypothetical protein
MFIKELKTTQAESIGKWWNRARIATVIAFYGSFAIFFYGNLRLAFAVAVTSALATSILNGREYVIGSLQRIRTIMALRERLLTHSDGKYVLESVKADQIWRGEEIDPEITSRLAEYEARDERIKDSVIKLIEMFNQDKVEDKTPN